MGRAAYRSGAHGECQPQGRTDQRPQPRVTRAYTTAQMRRFIYGSAMWYSARRRSGHPRPVPDFPVNHEKFSAADSALGYLYQVRVALLLALKRVRTSSDFSVALETLDDVVFEKSGMPDAVLQTKHHTKHGASLTNSCTDLWKTLRIWFELSLAGRLTDDTAFFLLTTTHAPLGSAASYLRTTDRNPGAAHRILQESALASESQANSAAYETFLRIPNGRRSAVLNNIFILDRSPMILSIEEELKSEVWGCTTKHQRHQLMQRLEGWWFQRVLQQLSSKAPISADEIELRVEDLREQFKREALPIDDEILYADEVQLRAALSSNTFVRQLVLARINRVSTNAAIRDFYRASEHRSRWLRENLLFVGELNRYDRKLFEEWELCFSRTVDNLPNECEEDSDIMAAKAKEVLSWAEQATFPLRPAMVEPFVSRGSFHRLADDRRIGWHPRFRYHFPLPDPVLYDETTDEEVA